MQAPTLNKSRQLANDLRKSHFTLGSADQRSKVSEYVSEYQRKKGGVEVPQSQGDKLNLRASHFQLGTTNEPNKTFKTISQKDYKEHAGFQTVKVDEDKKRDLRASHFVLGNHGTQYASLNHANFQEKHIPMNLHKQEQEEQKNKMRKHNHDFTETHKKQFSSEYNHNYNKQGDPASLKQALTSSELRQKVIDLRKSHVVLGEDYNPMRSIAQIDYQSKQSASVAPANDNVNIRKTNFQLGVAPNEFASMYQQAYVPHPTQQSNYQAALGQDLRATHFSLGQEGSTYATNASAAFKKPPSDFKKPDALNPNLQANHFSLGHPNSQVPNKTTYSNFHRDFGPAPTAQARDQNQDRGSHFQLGGQKGPWVTEAQSHFKIPEGGKAADLDGALKADLRSSHFKFDDVKNNHFKTVQQVSYVPKTAQPNKLDEGLKKDLQTNHFKLGNAGTSYGTSTGIAYQPTDGKASNLDPKLAKDLRTNHFSHGDGKWPMLTSTEYRSNYFWKNDNEATA